MENIKDTAAQGW